MLFKAVITLLFLFCSHERLSDDGMKEVVTEVPCSSVSTQLSGSWLILYQYICQASRKSNPPSREQNSNSRQSMLGCLCEVQGKLQELGVRIPTETDMESHLYLKGTRSP